MKTALFHEFGSPEVLRHEEVPLPQPGRGEVLVKVLAAGINRLDHYLREGSVTPDIAVPHVLGSDAAGVIESIGPSVTRLQPGDRVIPMPGYPLDPADEDTHPISAAPSYAIRGIVEWGAYAQYMIVPERWVVSDLTGLPPEQVATLPMAVVTGVRAVKVVGEVADGDSVLVQAGASGTGSINVQVARSLGARVVTTVRGEKKADFARKLGADLVIDVEREDFLNSVMEWTEGRGVDVAIDNLGGDVLSRSLDALRPLGILVAMGFVAGLQSTFHIRNFFFAQKQIRGSLMGDVEDLHWGLERVKEGKIRPLLDRTLPLKEAAEAHHLLERNGVLGNLVLLPWQD